MGEITELRKEIRKVSVYVNSFGDVHVPIDRASNREEMMVQGQMLRDVLNKKLCDMSESINDTTPQELKELATAIKEANDICLKAMGDHKDTAPQHPAINKNKSLKDVEPEDTEAMKESLKDVIKLIKKRKKEDDSAIEATLEETE